MPDDAVCVQCLRESRCVDTTPTVNFTFAVSDVEGEPLALPNARIYTPLCGQCLTREQLATLLGPIALFVFQVERERLGGRPSNDVIAYAIMYRTGPMIDGEAEARQLLCR